MCRTSEGGSVLHAVMTVVRGRFPNGVTILYKLIFYQHICVFIVLYVVSADSFSVFSFCVCMDFLSLMSAVGPCGDGGGWVWGKPRRLPHAKVHSLLPHTAPPPSSGDRQQCNHHPQQTVRNLATTQRYVCVWSKHDIFFIRVDCNLIYFGSAKSKCCLRVYLL